MHNIVGQTIVRIALDAKFDEWMTEIDILLNNRIGLSSMDLPDQMWRDSFEIGEEPWDAITGFFGDPDEIGEEDFMRNCVMNDL